MSTLSDFLAPYATRWRGGQAAIAAAAPAQHPLIAIIYIYFLVAFTDGTIWWMTGTVSGYDWRHNALYSIFAWPLWFFIGTKGLAAEQAGLYESGRWAAIDLLPGGPTAVIAGHSLAKSLKSRGLRWWVLLYSVTYLTAGGTPLGLMPGLLFMIIGTLNLTLAGILFRLLSTRGYSTVIASIATNLMYLLSGAVFPLGMVGAAYNVFRLNPFAAAVSLPVERLVHQVLASTEPAISGYSDIVVTCVWTLLLSFSCFALEERRRAHLHS